MSIEIFLTSALSLALGAVLAYLHLKLKSVEQKLDSLTEKVNHSTIKEVISGDLEPGVYLPKTDPVTKQTDYVKAHELKGPADNLFGIDDKSHNMIKDLLDTYNG